MKIICLSYLRTHSTLSSSSFSHLKSKLLSRSKLKFTLYRFDPRQIKHVLHFSSKVNPFALS